MMTATARPVAIKIDPDTRERVKRLAAARNRTSHWLMREAIHQYVEREAFRQDGIKAWNEYQATGRHLTGKEADAWLTQLESGQDVEPPECHACIAVTAAPR